MKNKILYSILTIFAIIFLTTSYCFATDIQKDTDKMKNDVRNTMENAENKVEGAAKGTSDKSKQMSNNIEEKGHELKSHVENTGKDIKNKAEHSTDYTAKRTSTQTDGKFLGMNTTMWIWMLLALATIGIIAVVYEFAKENKK